jgi:hypothetical protein
MTGDEYAKKLARYEQLMATPLPKAKPKPKPMLSLEVGEKLAEAAKANPDSVRVSAKSDEGVTVVDRPRRTEVLEVLEVDGQGRPALAQRYDSSTGAWGIVEFQQGYRRRPGATSDYDPLSRLRGDGQ